MPAARRCHATARSGSLRLPLGAEDRNVLGLLAARLAKNFLDGRPVRGAEMLDATGEAPPRPGVEGVPHLRSEVQRLVRRTASRCCPGVTLFQIFD